MALNDSNMHTEESSSEDNTTTLGDVSQKRTTSSVCCTTMVKLKRETSSEEVLLRLTKKQKRLWKTIMNTSTNTTNNDDTMQIVQNSTTNDKNNYHIMIDESESEQLVIDDDPSIKPISKYDIYVTTLPALPSSSSSSLFIPDAIVPLMKLPGTVRVMQVFDYLDSDSFTALLLTSKTVRSECERYPLVMENKKSIPTFYLRPRINQTQHYGSTQKFLERMIDYQLVADDNVGTNDGDDTTNDKLQQYTRMNILDVHKFDYCPLSIIKTLTTMIPQFRETIEILDLSTPTPTISKSISLPFALSYLVPNLRKIDLSNTDITNELLSGLADRCPLLESITWNNNTRYSSIVYMDGRDMESFRNLKEIIMDDSCFIDCYGGMSDLVLHFPNLYLFFKCCHPGSNTTATTTPDPHGACKLERLSIRHAYDYTNTGTTLSQNSLLKFVRNAPPTLKWFRSDLSPANMKLLRTERPDIELVN